MPMDLPAGRDQIGVSFAYRQGQRRWQQAQVQELLAKCSEQQQREAAVGHVASQGRAEASK